MAQLFWQLVIGPEAVAVRPLAAFLGHSAYLAVNAWGLHRFSCVDRTRTRNKRYSCGASFLVHVLPDCCEHVCYVVVGVGMRHVDDFFIGQGWPNNHCRLVAHYHDRSGGMWAQG